MVGKSPRHEYLSTNVNNILIWRKHSMPVVKSMENNYILNSVGIPFLEYYLGRNLEFLGEAWKNQGFESALSAKTYIQNVIPKFEGLFGRSLSPSRHS
jgi:hypothetical protein